jgi:hypothetical protein
LRPNKALQATFSRCARKRAGAPALAAMKSKYQQVVDIHEKAAASHDASGLRDISSLLQSWGIKARQDDGELLWINLSVPTSIDGTIIVGYRYRKRDSSLTEDLFEFSRANPNNVTHYYKGRLEEVRTEYAKTHKEQDVALGSFTSVNSCCLYLGKEHGS